MTEYTPGPWDFFFRKRGTTIEDNAAQLIATVGPVMGVGDVDANARLIAAAPDLLEAAEAMVRGIDRLKIPTVETALSAYIAELEAAIAKARGQS